jgi:DNA-binding MarR family transcriptional regulator
MRVKEITLRRSIHLITEMPNITSLAATVNSRKHEYAKVMSIPPILQMIEIVRRYEALCSRRMTGLQLRKSEWWLLIFLGRFEGGTQQEFADLMGIGKAGMVSLIDRLENLGLVERVPDINDRRRNRLRIAPDAKVLAKQIKCISRETDQLLTSLLSKDEVTGLSGTLKKIMASLTRKA